jgi:hypothetical protein
MGGLGSVLAMDMYGVTLSFLLQIYSENDDCTALNIFRIAAAII